MQRGSAKTGTNTAATDDFEKEKTRIEKTKTSGDQWNKEGPLQKHGD